MPPCILYISLIYFPFLFKQHGNVSKPDMTLDGEECLKWNCGDHRKGIKHPCRPNILLGLDNFPALCLFSVSFARSIPPLCGLTRIEAMKKTSLRVLWEAVEIAFNQNTKGGSAYALACQVSLIVKLSTSPKATACSLQIAVGGFLPALS